MAAVMQHLETDLNHELSSVNPQLAGRVYAATAGDDRHHQ